MTGTRQKWVELLCLGMGFPLLLALALTGGGFPQSIAFDCIQDSADRAPAAGGVAADAAADPAATVNLAGWRIFIHAATPDFSSLGPAAIAASATGAAQRAPGLWTVAVATTARSAPRFYRPQAPPYRA
jgi:hypothetical protein